MNFFDKVKNLPEELRDFFASNEVSLVKTKAFFLYKLGEHELYEFTAVGDIFVDELSLAELPITLMRQFNLNAQIAYGISFELNRGIFLKFPQHFKDAELLDKEWERLKTAPLVSEDVAMRRIYEMEPWLLDSDEESAEVKKNGNSEEAIKESKPAVAEKIATEKLTIHEALRKYPKLAEQSVGVNQISLNGSPARVRPTIKNWILDYQDYLGNGRHGTFERANYLFKNENARRTTPIEREKLTLVLRSFDDDELLEIDPQKEELVFPKNQELAEKVFAQKKPLKEVRTLPRIEEKEQPPVAHQAPSIEKNVPLTAPAKKDSSIPAETLKAKMVVELETEKQQIVPTPAILEVAAVEPAKPEAKSASRFAEPQPRENARPIANKTSSKWRPAFHNKENVLAYDEYNPLEYAQASKVGPLNLRLGAELEAEKSETKPTGETADAEARVRFSSSHKFGHEVAGKKTVSEPAKPQTKEKKNDVSRGAVEPNFAEPQNMPAVARRNLRQVPLRITPSGYQYSSEQAETPKIEGNKIDLSNL